MKNQYSFRLLWLGQSLANFADSLYILGLVSLVFLTTKSAILSSLVPVIRMCAMIGGGLIAPLLMERFRLTSLLIFSQLGQTVLLVSMIFTSINNSQITFWLWVFIATIAFCDGWTNPARNALVPRLVEKQNLMKANSLLATSDQVALLVGWSLGGFLAAELGSVSILWITFAFFSISTFSLMFIYERSDNVQPKDDSDSIWKAAGEGWKYLFSQPILKRITFMSLLEYAAGTVWAGAILLAFVQEVLHKDQSWWGWINASYFASSILGGILVMKYADYFKERLLFALFIGSIGMAVLTFAFTTIPIPYVSLILSLLLGLPYQIRQIAERTFLQTKISANLLPKVLASHQTMASAVFSISVLVMGWISDYFSVKSVYLIASIICTFSAFLAIGLRKENEITFQTETQDKVKDNKRTSY